jgi:hypothetical protein
MRKDGLAERGAFSFGAGLACHRTRRAPVSLVKEAVWALPRPDQVPS